MKNLAFFTLIGIFAFTSCKNENKKTEDPLVIDENVSQEEIREEIKTLNVALESKSGSNTVGQAIFTEENGKVRLEAKISGLTPGTHAVHIHEKADCSAADATSAGGHWNPTFASHGKWGDAAGYHKGDIGNFEADSDGNGKITMETDEWCIGCGDDTKDITGKSLIIHTGKDDFKTQPTGDAGGRISCGGIIQ